MELDYSEEGPVKVSMIKYTGNILRAFTENILGSATSSPAEHLFKVRYKKEAKNLLEDQDQSFHHATAQLLLMCSWERMDIQTAVEFFTNRVNQPN